MPGPIQLTTAVVGTVNLGAAEFATRCDAVFSAFPAELRPHWTNATRTQMSYRSTRGSEVTDSAVQLREISAHRTEVRLDASTNAAISQADFDKAALDLVTGVTGAMGVVLENPRVENGDVSGPKL